MRERREYVWREVVGSQAGEGCAEGLEVCECAAAVREEGFEGGVVLEGFWVGC